MPKVCGYDYDENEMRIRVNCLGCLYGASIEDFPMCMATVIDKIIEVKKVNTVVLAKEREYEYGPDQVAILREIADIIEDAIREGIISQITEKCRKFATEWNGRVQYIVLNLMRRDPLAAYMEMLRETRMATLGAKRASPEDLKAYNFYIKNVLEPLREKMEATKLMSLAKPYMEHYKFGDRSVYRQIFFPIVRPNFMLTRYMSTPPKNAIPIDRYMVRDTQIEIYRIPGTTQTLYFALPPEFKLSDEEYTVLDEARRFMAGHRPTEAQFVKTEKVRELFFSIGKDVLRDTADRLGMHMTSKKIEQLANILTRYTAGMGVLEILLGDEKVQDLFVNSPIETQPILIFHQDFEECRTNLVPTINDAEAWATRLRIISGRPLDEANPVLDTELEVPGGRARFAVITKTLSPYGLGFAVRRHRDKPWTIPLFMKNNMISPLAGGLFSFLIDGAVSMLIAGGRSSGKTSLLGSLMLEILPRIRVITVEDTLELPIKQLIDLDYNIESMKSRSVITRVETEMPADEALRTSLRLGDSALIIGEIRSLEAKALWEAMRIGALSNIVAGTIHGESAYGVYDRVVNDLGVPPTSFKATDMIFICKALRTADGLHRFRRLTEVTEVRKEWDKDPMKEGAFVNLMEYSSKSDVLKPTDTLVNGESEILNRIASYVREYSGNWEAVWENINLRAKMKQRMVEAAEKLNKPELLEAEWNVAANSKFHNIAENIRKETGFPDPQRVWTEWERWFSEAVKRK